MAKGYGGIIQTEHEDLGDVLSDADFLYITRIQKERFASQEASRVLC